MQSNRYLHPNEEKNCVFRLLLVFIIAEVSYVVLPIITIVLYLLFTHGPQQTKIFFENDDENLAMFPPFTGHVLLHVSLIIAFLIIWLSVNLILKRSLTSVFTPNVRMNWKLIFRSFFVFCGLWLLSILIDVLFLHDTYQFKSFNAPLFFSFIVISVLLVPIQTTIEEFSFRGILVQLLSKKLNSAILISIMIGFLFGVLHFISIEFSLVFFIHLLDIIFVGFMLTYLSVKLGTSEFALAAHAANNIMLTLFIDTGEDLPSLVQSVASDKPLLESIVSLSCSILMFGLYYAWASKQNIQLRD